MSPSGFVVEYIHAIEVSWVRFLADACISISGRVVEYILAIGVTRVRFSASGGGSRARGSIGTRVK